MFVIANTGRKGRSRSGNEGRQGVEEWEAVREKDGLLGGSRGGAAVQAFKFRCPLRLRRSPT